MSAASATSHDPTGLVNMLTLPCQACPLITTPAKNPGLASTAAIPASSSCFTPFLTPANRRAAPRVSATGGAKFALGGDGLRGTLSARVLGIPGWDLRFARSHRG